MSRGPGDDAGNMANVGSTENAGPGGPAGNADSPELPGVPKPADDPRDTSRDPAAPPRRRHRREHRVRARRDFEAVYAARTSKRFGPLQVHGGLNACEHARLGMAVPRRVGNAPRRNRIRRRIREAFRLVRADLPAVDLVVHVRPHDPLLTVDELQEILRRAAENLGARLGVGP